MWVVAVFGVTVLISLVLLCVGCREKKKPSGNGTVPDNSAPPLPQTSVKENQAASNVAMNGSHDHTSLSRHSSLSSRGSVRITITNLAESDPGNVENLDSPGCVSQHSGGGNSMADRELPKLPPPREEEDNDHDYDVLDEHKLPFCSLTPPPADGSTVDYDTIENLVVDYTTLPRVSDTPNYMTVQKETTISFPSTSGQCRSSYEPLPDVVRRPSYDALPAALRRPSYDGMSGEVRRPSYKCLPELMRGDRPASRSVDKSATIGPIGRSSPRSFSEVYDASGKPINKSRSGSERKPRDNEDTVSVIYASINPEFRTKRQESLDKPTADYSTAAELEVEPPVPENPYAMLDNLLEDLQIPNPDYMAPTNNNNETTDDRIYEDLENMRPNSDFIEELSTPYSSARRTNPIIMKSSPYAVSNTSKDTPSASPICFVEQNDGLK